MKLFFILFLFQGFIIQYMFKLKYVNHRIDLIIYKKDTTITDKLFEVIKIDSVKKVYLIYAKRNDSVFKIVSKKECKFKCRNVLIGEKYAFELTSFHNVLPDVRRGTGIKYNDTIIMLEGGNIIRDLFTCKSLDNLCFTKHD